jgi:GNAT superfamily N-acetyltransferase
VIEAARPALGDDVARLSELAEEAVAEQRDGRGGAVWSRREARALPADADLAAAVADCDRLVLAGTIDDSIVGYAVVGVEELRDGTRLGRIDDLYVEPDARAVGVGEALVDAIVAWCAERECRGIDALALPGNRDTKNFFEAHGFTARALVVHKRL